MKRIIPFGLLPSSWGLRGKSRQRAEAEYYLEGHELEVELLNIDHPSDSKKHKLGKANIDLKYGKLSDLEHQRIIASNTLEGKTLALALLSLDHQEAKITTREYDEQSAEISFTGDELAVKKLEIQHQYGDIDDHTFRKGKATILKEPFIEVIHSSYDATQGLNGLAFEFDWNEYWIVQLKENGYQAASDDQLVAQWFDQLCRSVIQESANNDVIPFNSGRIINRVSRDSNTTDFS